MDKRVNATRLLRAMSDVDDKYIEEALETSASKRAVVTPLRRYSGVIAIVAALLLLIGGGLFGFSKYINKSKTASETVAAHNQAVNAPEMFFSRGAAPASAERSNDTVPAAEETLAEALGVDGGLVTGGEGNSYDYSIANPVTVYTSLEDLEDRCGFDFDVPDSVNDSTSCVYNFYDTAEGLAEVRYLDDDGNVICTVRKSPVEADISGCYDCFSITEKVDVDGLDNVMLSGNASGFGLATWMQGDYSYSIRLDETVSGDAIIDLISQVS